MSPSQSVQRIAWVAGFIGFAVLNVWAFAVGGVEGFVDFLTSLGPFELLSIVDLLLALLIGMVFVHGNARRRTLDARPFLLVTLLTGSLGLLGYLARHGTSDRTD